MAAAGRPPSVCDGLPTPSELVDMRQKCETLVGVTLKQRYSHRSGRYSGVDTARRKCVLTRVLPGLKFGRLPSAEDHRALFELGAVADMSAGDKHVQTTSCWS